MQQQSHRVPEQDAQDRSSVRKVLAELGEGIGLITFNQPEKRNAMSVDMWDALSDILDAWVNDPQVRVVVLTGAGEKAFVSGADEVGDIYRNIRFRWVGKDEQLQPICKFVFGDSLDGSHLSYSVGESGLST